TGPQWFTVLHPDGSTWEYGRRYNSEVTATNGSGQTVGRIWALDRIEDASGNLITFHYSQPGGTNSYYPTRIEWGGNANQHTSTDHGLVINYPTLPASAVSRRYVVGTLNTRNRKVSKLTLRYNNGNVLRWTPQYSSTGSGHARLVSLK